MRETVRQRAVVTGRVQGVGFRYYVRQVAGGSQVTGFVRNLPDSSVEVEVQGPVQEVERFLDDLRIGPPGSKVDDVSVQPLSVRPEEDGFDIRM
jgi:acylphosphatase